MTRTILLVVPDATEREALAELLTAAAFRVEVAASASAARSALARSAPDLAVVASTCPAPIDLDLVRGLRHRAQEGVLPILVLCPDSSVAARIASLDAGASDSLSRPIEPAQLVHRIQVLLDRRDQLPSRAPLGVARRVLVVDDSLTYAHALMDVLRRDGHDLAFAETGADALAFLERHRADLVILDVFLPDQNGIEVCRRIKTARHTATIPVLILTGREKSAVREAATTALADGFATKGRDFAAISGKVLALLRRAPPRATSSARLTAAAVEVTRSVEGTALFDAVVRHTGLSDLLARSTVESACRRLDLRPHGLSRADVPRLVETLARTLQLFLPPEEARTRLAELNDLGR